jgi:hypothetical protein
MGIKPWHRLSLLVLAGAVLAGCNTTNPRDGKYLESKGSPYGAQSNPNPPQFPTAPGNAKANDFGSPFKQTPTQNPALANQQKPLYNQTSGGNLVNQSPVVPPVNQQFTIGQQPQVPGDPLAPNPNPGLPPSSSRFGPQTQTPQIPAFQPIQPGQVQPGQVALPGARFDGQIGQSEIFRNPQQNQLPAPPPNFR